MNRTAVFVAASDREAERVELLLNREHIAYELETVIRERDGACFQALQFNVGAEDVERCRRLLAALSAG